MTGKTESSFISRLMIAAGLSLNLAALVALEGERIPLHIRVALDTFKPGTTDSLPAIVIVAGMMLIFFSGAAIRPLGVDEERSISPWFASKRSALIFIASILAYAGVAINLATNGFSSFVVPAFIVCVIGITVSLYQKKEYSEPSGLALDRTDLILVMGIVLCAAFFLTRDLLFWYFSYIGDEFPFYEMARAIANQDVSPNILGYRGVYKKFPFADSYYTASFLKLWGDSIRTWKVSNVVVHIATVVLVYTISKNLYGRTAAVVSSLCLTFSQYFMAFDKIGYNNTHICFTSSLTMLLFVWGCKTSSKQFFFLTGISLGLLTYSNWGGLVTWPVVGGMWLSLVLKHRSFRFATMTSATMAVGLVIAVSPGLLSNSFQDICLVTQELNHNRSFEAVGFKGLFAALVKSASAFWGKEGFVSFYVSSPLVDSVTSSLMIGGIALSLRNIRRLQSILILTWLFVGLVGVVFLSRSSDASITRLLYLLPPVSIIAGSSAEALLRGARIPSLRMIVMACMAISVFALNIQKLYFVSGLTRAYQEMSLIIAELRGTAATQLVYVFPGNGINGGIKEVLTAYVPAGKQFHILTEEQVRNALGAGELPSFMRTGKIIARLSMQPLLDEMLAAGSIPGPVTRVSLRCCGSIVTANDTESSLGLMHPRNFFQLFTFWMNEIVYGEFEALHSLRGSGD